MKFAIEEACPRVWLGYNRKGGGSWVNTKNLVMARCKSDLRVRVERAILESEYGITASELVELTGSTRRQVHGVIHKNKSIKKIGGKFGSEIYAFKDYEKNA